MSKANTPILILLAPWLGVRYSRRETALAALAAVVLLTFTLVERGENEHPVGFLLVALTLALVVTEYVLLSRSAIRESAFVVIAVPSVSCALFGLGGALATGSPLLGGSAPLWIAALGGVVMFLFYSLSIRRYRMLPLGISELPALFSAFVIVAAERSFFSVTPTPVYLIFLVTVTALLSSVAWLRMFKVA